MVLRSCALLVGLSASSALGQVSLLRDTSRPLVAEAAGPVLGMLDERTFIAHASAQARDGAAPSIALLQSRPAIKPLVDGATRLSTPPLSPRFGTIDGRASVSLAIEPGTSLYGTGSAAGPLLRNGRQALLWNYDNYGYDDSAVNLYQSHPWVLGVRADGSAFGVLFDTTYRLSLSLPGIGGGDLVAISEGPSFPVILISGTSPQDVVSKLAELTGYMPLPPKWSLGYHQCRYSYNPEARVKEVAQGFRDRKIPLDVIWLDIDYMDQFRTFTFDPEQFPDPKGLNAWLKERGIHNTWMINPGVAADESKFRGGRYHVYEQAMARGFATRQADGSVFVGEVWPGKCVFPDFLNKGVRDWWATLYPPFMANGIDGVWNDMNEPAVFNTLPDPKYKTMPETNLHNADPEIGGPGDHLRYHNVYGMFMVKASREGIQASAPDKRPFVLSRANFLGGHRYAAMWTGDNVADWYHLESSVPMAINMGLSGQPFAGPDIGGFAGSGPKGAEGELFERWMGFATLLPFARGHTGKGNIDKEPWSFGPEVEQTSRDAIGRRYRFMPYIYTLFREASVNGLPVVRPLFFHDATDPALRGEDDAFLLGGDVLVAPELVPDRSRVLTLPRDIDKWAKFDFSRSSRAVQDPEEPDEDLPAMYLRPGAIVPTGPLMQYTDERPLDPLTLLINLNEEGEATGQLYEDAGNGYGYQKGDYLLTTYRAQREGESVKVTIAASEGERARIERRVIVRVFVNGTEYIGGGRDGGTIVVNIAN